MKISLPQHQLLRQLLGAAGGTLVAFALYGTFELVAPRLGALLPQSLETSEGRVIREREERKDSIIFRAQQALERQERL